MNYEQMVVDLLGQRVSLAGGSLLLPGRLVAIIGIVGWVGSSKEDDWERKVVLFRQRD